MYLNTENAPINIPCPACGHEQTQTFGELKRVANLTCPSCGIAFEHDIEKLDAGFQDAEKMIAKMAIDLAKLNKK